MDDTAALLAQLVAINSINPNLAPGEPVKVTSRTLSLTGWVKPEWR
jgi:hypothetical protein